MVIPSGRSKPRQGPLVIQQPLNGSALRFDCQQPITGLYFYPPRRCLMPTEQTSLYDRLGGVYSIATVVDDFINRIMIDPS